MCVFVCVVLEDTSKWPVLDVAEVSLIKSQECQARTVCGHVASSPLFGCDDGDTACDPSLVAIAPLHRQAFFPDACSALATTS